jgi:hypothetical protein
MKKIKNYAGRGGLGRSAFISVGVLLAGVELTGTLNAGSPQHYNVLVADSQATVYLVDPATGERAIFSQGGKLDRPYDLARKRDGTIVVSDTGTLRIVQLNPATGDQTVVAEGGELGVPYGIDVDQHDRIYVANGRGIVRVDSKSLTVEPIASGGLLQVPLDVAVASDGTLYVADARAGIIRIDLAKQQQSLLTSGGMLHQAIGIALDGNRSAYVADAGGQCVVSVDLRDGSQKLVSMAGYLTSPVGLAVAPGGTVLVSDPDAFDFDGGVMTISTDGTQNPITRGFGDLVNARGIAIVPAQKSH